jgi:hypothetical protein
VVLTPDAPLIMRDGSSRLTLLVGWGEARRKLAEPIGNFWQAIVNSSSTEHWKNGYSKITSES